MRELQFEFPDPWPGLTRELDARTAADEAVNRVGQNANEAWMWEARVSVREVSARMPTFTTDDVWADLEMASAGDPEFSTHEPRAMGAVMRWAAKEGLCVATPAYERSSRRECHARPVRVWRSLLG